MRLLSTFFHSYEIANFVKKQSMPKLVLKPAHELIPLMVESKRQMLADIEIDKKNPKILKAIEELRKLKRANETV